MLPHALVIVGMLWFCGCGVQNDQEKTKRYILDSERQWAEPLLQATLPQSNAFLLTISSESIPKAANMRSNK